jgi:hypothetical protein
MFGRHAAQGATRTVDDDRSLDGLAGPTLEGGRPVTQQPHQVASLEFEG